MFLKNAQTEILGTCLKDIRIMDTKRTWFPAWIMSHFYELLCDLDTQTTLWFFLENKKIINDQDVAALPALLPAPSLRV